MFYINFINFYFLNSIKNFFRRNNFEYFLHSNKPLEFTSIIPIIKFRFLHRHQRFSALKFRALTQIKGFDLDKQKKWTHPKQIMHMYYTFTIHGFSNIVKANNNLQFYLFYMLCNKNCFISHENIKPGLQKKFHKQQFFGKTFFNHVKKQKLFFSKINFNNTINEFFKKRNFFFSNIIFKPVNLLNLFNRTSLNLLNINFLRKNKVFNKGRYSRNRQYYRTGVYWCLYINIIAVFGFYFWFFKLTFNFSYLWWLLYVFISSFFIPKTLNFNNLNIFKSIFETFIWFFNLIYSFFFFNIFSKLNLFFFKKILFQKYFYLFIKN